MRNIETVPCRCGFFFFCAITRRGATKIKVFKEALFSGFPDPRSVPFLLKPQAREKKKSQKLRRKWKTHSHKMRLDKCSSQLLVYNGRGIGILEKTLLEIPVKLLVVPVAES